MPLAEELAASGFQIDIAVLNGSTAVPRPQVSSAENTVHYHFLNVGRLDKDSWLAGGKAVAKLRTTIRQRQPDILHAWCGHTSWISLVANWLAGNRQSRRMFYTELWLQPQRRFFRQQFQKWLSDEFETLIVPHPMITADIRELGFQGPVEVLPNRIQPLKSVDRTEARQRIRAQLKLPLDSHLAGTVAPLAPRSRIKDLIWATDLLACVRNDFHLLIFGSGWQLDRLRWFARCTESHRHVHFLGQPTEAREWITGLDFYWHSHLQEPLPCGLLTSMAEGIPAVSVFGPGTDELIRHQVTGFAINTGARDEFARWTKYLIEQAEPGQRLAHQGQQHVQSNFSGSLVEDYLRIYN